MAYKDLYNILGVGKDASEKEIKKAYRKQASEFHPDKTKGNKAKEEKFKEISEAYQVLGNPEKRKQYDTLGADWDQFQRSGHSYEDFVDMRERVQRTRSSQQHREGYADFGGAADFSDIFESFFAGGASGFGAPHGSPKGADVSGEVHISLQEAFSGTERILNIDGNKIKLKIKPGAYSGLKLRAKGKGQKGGHGRAGDLYLNVLVDPHPVYKRRGNDLYMKAGMSMFDALLGGKLEVITLSGMVNITIKEGTQNGKTVRLRGKGMPVYGSSNRFGDLFITLDVKLPEKLTATQKELVRDLKNSVKQQNYESKF